MVLLLFALEEISRILCLFNPILIKDHTGIKCISILTCL